MGTLNKRLYDDYIWGLKYRPTNVKELILPERIKKIIEGTIENGQIPNMLFSGSAGTGKTSTAAIICDTLGYEYLYLNLSEQTGIDVLRSNIRKFITSISFENNGKIVILDEAERASAPLQDALKSALEEFSKTCRFIFISNHKNKIIPPLQSRLQSIEFRFQSNEIQQLKKSFFKRCLDILKNENVDYNDKVVAHVLNNLFPDMRRTLNELQKFSVDGTINDMSTIKTLSIDTDAFYSIIKSKRFNDLSKYVSQLSGDSQSFFSSLYDTYKSFITPETCPDFIILLKENTYKSAFIVDSRITIMSFAVEVMRQCDVID